MISPPLSPIPHSVTPDEKDSGESSWRVCSRCGKRFRAAAKARYCSNKCRQAAYRDRKERQSES